MASRCFLLHSTKSRSACENTNIEIELQHNCNESLLRSSFEMLRAGTISVVQADLHYRRHLLWSSFHTWQKHASILRKIKFGIGRQRVRVGSRCFEEWKENAQFVRFNHWLYSFSQYFFFTHRRAVSVIFEEERWKPELLFWSTKALTCGKGSMCASGRPG